MKSSETNISPDPAWLDRMTRRGFMEKIIGAIAALIGLALVIPLAGYLILPALRKKSKSWVSIAKTGTLPTGKPVSIELATTQKNGWLTSTTLKSVWALKKEKGDVVVYAPLCTHLGCGYRWEPDRNAFFCPCHASIFDINGKVLAGPAPRPLDTLPTKIEKGKIWIIYKEFKAGTSKKIEL